MRTFAPALAGLLTALVAASAQATPIEFAPPGVSGRVYTTNSSDGWANGRGLGFTVDASTELTSIGLYQDVVDVTLSYGVYEIGRNGNSFGRISTLASGSMMATTSGLEWIDVAIAPVTLTPGVRYQIDFQFPENSNQNFFYDHRNIAWSQSGFSDLDGTQGNSFINTFVAAFRVDVGGASVVPLPAAAPLLATALGGVALVRARRKAAV